MRIYEDDGADFVIPGARLEHVITVVTDTKIDRAVKILQAAQSAGANLESLTSNRYGDRLDHRLRLSGIATSQARAVSEDIARLLGISSATIDRHILSRSLESPPC